MRRTLLLLVTGFVASWAAAQQAATSPANESRSPDTVRSPHSIGADLAVPLCPAQFHDSLGGNGIAGRGDQGVTQAAIRSTVPALLTQQAIDGAGNTHIGNFSVIVNVVVGKNGHPRDLCLRKSSGYGLDASAAAAVGQYRFTPAKKQGRPVRTRLPVEVRFVSPNPPPIGLPRTGVPPH